MVAGTNSLERGSEHLCAALEVSAAIGAHRVAAGGREYSSVQHSSVSSKGERPNLTWLACEHSRLSGGV